MQPIEYIDLLRNRNDWSDYRAAKELGIGRNHINEVRAGRSKSFGDKTAIKIAGLLGMDPLKVVADMHAAKETDEETVVFWKKISGAAVLLFSLTIANEHTDYNGNVILLDIDRAIHYAQSWVWFLAVLCGFSVFCRSELFHRFERRF